MHDDDGSTLFGLPLRNFLFERIHKTHEMCGDKILRMCLTSDAKCVLTVRNPLDTIVSIANKSKKLVALLDTEWLLRAVARGLIAYYRSFSDAFPTGLVHVVRYEDLLVHFEKATKGLASLIGAVLTHDEIAALKSRLWNAPVAMPGHLWKPGQDKWKEYLTPRSLAILREEGIGGLMERLGYDFSGKEHVAGVPISTVPPRRPTLHGVSFFTHCMGTIEETLAEFSVNTHGMLPYASA
jgi:hypothetical protein